MSNEYDHIIKFIMLGDSGVGKTNISTVYFESSFYDSFMSTIGVDFFVKVIKVNHQNVKLQIWDTAGQEKFMTLISSYFRGSQVALITFDLTNMESFTNIQKWINCVREKSENVIIFLLGNKCDNVNHIVVKHELINELCAKNNIQYYPVSAKENINIDTVFYEAAKCHINTSKLKISQQIIKIEEKKPNKKKFFGKFC